MLITKPGPWRITFDTNPDDCNLRCIMCEGFSPHSAVKADRVATGTSRRRMDINLIRQILQKAQGSPLKEIIPSTMGEPLLYQHFEEIIQLCHEYQVKLNLTTNGTFPRKSAEEWSRLLVPITSDVKFSWNGATKETQEKIMLGSKWEKVLENVKTFIRIRNAHAAEGGNRCRVTLQLTFLETNVGELADIVKLGIDLGVDRIKGHHLWAHFKEIKNLSMRRSPEAIKRWNETIEKVHQIAETYLLPNGNPILLENMGFLDNEAQVDINPEALCPFLAKEAWVNTEGRFSPCCAPDKERQTLGEFGNLYDTTLEDIWQSEPYNNLQKNYKDHALCIGCNMRKPITEASLLS
jgi:MoaA/NifB/PqqE/SkfB family radical SAM enzyme